MMVALWRVLVLAIPLALAAATPVDAAKARDGAHDFDFKVGTWKTHIRRLRAPLTGSSDWTELDGSVVVRPVWGGKALLEEVDASGGDAAGPGVRFEGLTLFLYDPAAHQWGMSFSNVKTGRIIGSAPFGEFRDGRGVFYDRDTLDGRGILIRIVWSDIGPDAHRFEQSFSADGGVTWEPNFVARLTRVAS